MIRRPPRSTQSRSSAASDVYKRQSLILSPFVLVNFTSQYLLSAVLASSFCGCLVLPLTATLPHAGCKVRLRESQHRWDWLGRPATGLGTSHPHLGIPSAAAELILYLNVDGIFIPIGAMVLHVRHEAIFFIRLYAYSNWVLVTRVPLFRLIFKVRVRDTV